MWTQNQLINQRRIYFIHDKILYDIFNKSHKNSKAFNYGYAKRTVNSFEVATATGNLKPMSIHDYGK